MTAKILVTIGPSSLHQDVISEMENEGIYLFRINLSHTPMEEIESVVKELQRYTNIPICLDSEGAQIRNQSVINGEAVFQKGDVIKIHFEEVVGDAHNISFSPENVAKQIEVGDNIFIDFDSAQIVVIEKKARYSLARVVVGGRAGSNKAVDLARNIELKAITDKDKRGIAVGKKMGIRHFALSFAGSSEDVKLMRELAGKDSIVFSKIESVKGILNLEKIIQESDEILIDRGDLSRQVDIEKIPFFQRRIVAMARLKAVPVHVATNLLESMVKSRGPTRAEVNDVVSSLLMGVNGLVLASETAVGKYPVEAVRMIRRLIREYSRWTPNTSLSELMAANMETLA